MQSSLLGWGTVQSCLFRCNNAEFSVRIGQRFSFAFFDISMQSSLFGGATVFLVFFDITMQSSPLGWSTVQSSLFRYNNGSVPCSDWERFSLAFFDITMQSSLLGWATGQSCLFRRNNEELPVRIGNGSA